MINNEKISLLIVDDYPVVLSGLTCMVKGYPEIELVGIANNGVDAVEQAIKLHPKVVLMNVSMPGMDGIEATLRIKKHSPDINILIFSGISSQDKVTPAINAGAIGYILKDSPEEKVINAIKQVARGEACLHSSVIGYILKQVQTNEEQENLIQTLTERELEVLKLMGEGLSNQQIAQKIVVGHATVHSHVSRILAKLKVSSRTQAVVYAMRIGLIPPPDEANHR